MRPTNSWNLRMEGKNAGQKPVEEEEYDMNENIEIKLPSFYL
jgi:hypothetical protein